MIILDINRAWPNLLISLFGIAIAIDGFRQDVRQALVECFHEGVIGMDPTIISSCKMSLHGGCQGVFNHLMAFGGMTLSKAVLSFNDSWMITRGVGTFWYPNSSKVPGTVLG